MIDTPGVVVATRAQYEFIELSGEASDQAKLEAYIQCLDKNENAKSVSILSDIRRLRTVLGHEAVAALMDHADSLNIGKVDLALVTNDPGRILYRDLVHMVSDVHKVVVRLDVFGTIGEAEVWLKDQPS